MTRDEMVEALVDHTIRKVIEVVGNCDPSFLAEIIEGNGWGSYSQLTDAQILVEYNETKEYF